MVTIETCIIIVLYLLGAVRTRLYLGLLASVLKTGGYEVRVLGSVLVVLLWPVFTFLYLFQKDLPAEEGDSDGKK
jgi:hypothetical protein